METIICIWWDSITMWAWDIEKWWRANRLHSFLWKKYLQENGDYAVVYNLGIDGDTSTWILKRFSVEAEARDPNVIIFAIWANDCVNFENKENLVPLPLFEKNIQELIQHAKKYTEKIIFIWLIACDEDKMNPMERAPELYQNMENINRYNDTIQKICGKEKVYFVDMLDAIKKGNLEDGCHPKAEGHEKMYIKIRDFLLDKKILYNES